MTCYYVWKFYPRLGNTIIKKINNNQILLFYMMINCRLVLDLYYNSIVIGSTCPTVYVSDYIVWFVDVPS